MNKPTGFSGEDTLFQQMMWGIDRGAFNDALGQSLVRAWKLGAADHVVKRLIADKLRPLQKAQATGELPPFKKACLTNGELVLGKDFYAPTIRMPLSALNCGGLGAGNTGSGKSYLLCSLLLQLPVMGPTFWAFENYKHWLRRLRGYLGRRGIQVVILRPADWRWNLLQPSGDVELRDYLAMAGELLVRALGLPPRARSILSRCFYELYGSFGNWAGRTDAYPNLFDAYEWVAARSALNAPAREAILDRIGSFLVSLTPQCGAFRIGWRAKDLVRFNIVWEMGGASETIKHVQIESTLFSVFHGEVSQNVTSARPKLLVCVDDGQRMFDTSNQPAGDVSALDELAGVMRGGRLGLWLNVQTCYGLSKRLLPNLGSKFMGRLGAADDYATLGASMGLTSEQIEWAKVHLRPGMFIGQLVDYWREPFLFTAPLLHLPDSVTDSEAADSVKILDALPTVFADEYRRWELHPVAEVRTSPNPKPLDASLSELELRFLRAIVANPAKPSGAYARMAKLNGQRAAEIRKRLIELGYLREHTVALGARGRPSKVLEPLAPAYVATAQASKEGE